MSYVLQAVISRDFVLRDSKLSLAQVVPLAQGFSMIPVTAKLCAEVESTWHKVGEAFPGFEELSPSVAEWVRTLSEKGVVAYVDAEFFGGDGGQSAVAWLHGRMVLEPVHSEDAINQALKLLGVEIGNARDQFDALELGRHRFTDEWLSGGAI